MTTPVVVPLPSGQIHTLFAHLDQRVPAVRLDDWVTAALTWWTRQDLDHYDSGALMPFPAAGHVHRMGLRRQTVELNVWLALADDEGWWPVASANLLDETSEQVCARVRAGHEWLRNASDNEVAAMFAKLPAVPFLVDLAAHDTAPSVDSQFELDAELWDAVVAKAGRLEWSHSRAVRQAITDRLYLEGVPAGSIGYWPSNVAVAARSAAQGHTQSVLPPRTENPVWRLPAVVQVDPPLVTDYTPLGQAL